MQQIQSDHQFGKACTQRGACRAQPGAGEGQGAEPDGTGRENKQGVEHDIQHAHDHHADTGRAHIACGLQLAGCHIIELEGGQKQAIHQEVGGGILPNVPVCPKYSGQRPGQCRRQHCHDHAEPQAQHQRLLEDIAGLGQAAAAYPLGRQHIEAHSRRIRQLSEEPGGGGHQPHRRRLGRTQTAHHSCIDILHDDGGELCHNGRPTELQRQGQLLTGSQRRAGAQLSQGIRFQGRTSRSVLP